MKNLNKKIGAMVLASAIVIGGSLSSLSFANANPLNDGKIYRMISYNSTRKEDREKMSKSFNESFGVEVIDLEDKFENMGALEEYLKKLNVPRVYQAVVKADPNRESEDYNIVFSYGFDFFKKYFESLSEED